MGTTETGVNLFVDPLWAPKDSALLFSSTRTSPATLRALSFATTDAIGTMRYHPGGRVVAHTRSIDGESQVFVQRYDGTGEAIRVAAGRWPRWSRHGSELLFVDPDDNIVGVPVRARGAVAVDAAAVLAPGSVFAPRRVSWLEVAPDGQRFYVKLESGVRTLNVVLNWPALLR